MLVHVLKLWLKNGWCISETLNTTLAVLFLHYIQKHLLVLCSLRHS